MKIPKWIRKRLTVTILASVGSAVIVPLLINFGLDDQTALAVWALAEARIIAWVVGQSVTDKALIEKGLKTQ